MEQNACYEIEPFISNNSEVSKGTQISHADTNPICVNEEKNRPRIVSRPKDPLSVLYFLSGFDEVQACVSEREPESRYSVIYEKSV